MVVSLPSLIYKKFASPELTNQVRLTKEFLCKKVQLKEFYFYFK